MLKSLFKFLGCLITSVLVIATGIIAVIIFPLTLLAIPIVLIFMLPLFILSAHLKVESIINKEEQNEDE